MQGSREPCISFLYYAASIGIETVCIGYLSLSIRICNADALSISIYNALI